MSNEQKSKRTTHALIFELEFVATTGRKVMYDALVSALNTKGVELTDIKYAKSEMSPVPRAAVTQLLLSEGKRADNIEKAVAEVTGKIKTFCENDAELDKGLKKLIQAALEKNIAVLTFSAWPENVATSLMQKLGLDEMGVELIIPDEVKASFPRADSWLKILKKSEHEHATLVAVISSQTACKGALTAGAACVSVPDKFTEFQDFSGSKLILESLNDMKATEILDLTLRM